MASRNFHRNLLSLDTKLVFLEAVALFAANGAPLLEKWVPPSSVDAHYDPAESDSAVSTGAEGFYGVRKRATGDFVFLLQDRYQRFRALLSTFQNSAHLGVTAPEVQILAGELDSASAYPDLTSLQIERLEAGHSGTAVAAEFPTFTVNSAVFPSTVVGMIFTDASGVQATITDAATDTLTLSGTVTPATGAGWTITSGGTLILNSTILSGARSSTGYVAATFTDGAATWLVNRWQGHYLKDSAGNRFLIASNTATALTLKYQNDAQPDPTTGAYVIEQGYQPGTQYGVTGPQITETGNTGTGTANTWTPATHTNWVAGIFAGMYLIDADGVPWLITTNSTTALTVADNGGSDTPTSGDTWSIVTIAAAASIEISTAALALASTALTGAPTAGTLAVSSAAADLNGALTGGTALPFVSDVAGTVSGAPAKGTLAVNSGATSPTLTDPASGEKLLLTLFLSDSVVQS